MCDVCNNEHNSGECTCDSVVTRAKIVLCEGCMSEGREPLDLVIKGLVQQGKHYGDLNYFEKDLVDRMLMYEGKTERYYNYIWKQLNKRWTKHPLAI